MSAFYPIDAFDIEKAYEGLGGEYAILIKLHPFCKERFEIPNQYSDVIIDMSEDDELNDLLFVTDLLVTDYSSVIFEASIVDVPMLFYAFDLNEYSRDRDFYCNFSTFVPGKIVLNTEEMIDSINCNDYKKSLLNHLGKDILEKRRAGLQKCCWIYKGVIRKECLIAKW